MSSNENPAQTNISTDRDQDPASSTVHEGAPAPEDVPAPGSRRDRSGRSGGAGGEHRCRRAGGDGLEPGPQPRQPRGQHGRDLQPQPRQDRAPDRRAPGGGVRSGRDVRGVRGVAEQAPDGDHHGQGGCGHGCRDRRARGRVRAGRHHRRRRQRPVHRHDPPREGGARDRDQLRRRRDLRRRRGRAARPVDHARRLGRVLGDPRPDPEVHRRDRRGRAVRHARRPRRRRSLREDGAQRHRVRRHAADRRGVRPDPPRHRQDAPPRSRTCSPSGTRASWSRT